ncbi:hypothetical protein D3C81_1733930 [compost metagenome]
MSYGRQSFSHLEFCALKGCNLTDARAYRALQVFQPHLCGGLRKLYHFLHRTGYGRLNSTMAILGDNSQVRHGF